MRISDWSSDVCSSDLAAAEGQLDLEGSSTPASTIAARRALAVDRLIDPMHAALDAPGLRKLPDELEVPLVGVLANRKSVAQGKSVSVRGDHGGRRTSQKKQTAKHPYLDTVHSH